MCPNPVQFSKYLYLGLKGETQTHSIKSIVLDLATPRQGITQKLLLLAPRLYRRQWETTCTLNSIYRYMKQKCFLYCLTLRAFYKIEENIFFLFVEVGPNEDQGTLVDCIFLEI